MRAVIEARRFRKAEWARLQEAKKQGRPIVAAIGLLPREIWHALDVPAMILEDLSVRASARNLSGIYCDIAEQQGFARELCAVHLSLAGIAASEEHDPFIHSIFVQPDLIIGRTFPCISESKSFLYWVERFGRPYHLVDVPINTWGSPVAPHAVDYLTAELDGMLEFLEKHGFKRDPVRLSQSVLLSRKAMELWQEVEKLRKVVPSPMTAGEALSCIANPMMLLLGSEAAVRIFLTLRDELAERVKAGHGVIPNEKLRLLLVGIPPLYNLTLMSYPERFGAVVVKSDLDFLGGSPMPPEMLLPEQPLHSLARKLISDLINPCSSSKVDYTVGMVKEYHIDGVIGLNKRGCRNFPATLRLIKDAVQREAGVPMTIFDLDGIDPREYDESQVVSHIDSFIETLARRR
ncbi:MAG: 2-hydroxyacyl-CoA dehydratase [Chloroflexi bacterium]|nr:2-hydroxyacyl-CoA dehydratase [Chloroflexota bacterium]